MIKINNKPIKEPIKPIYIKDAEKLNTEELFEKVFIDPIIKENPYV